MSTGNKVVDSDKSKSNPLCSPLPHIHSQPPTSNLVTSVWACLITNEAYLPGLLALEFSLRRVKSNYPLVALHTGSLPDKTLHALSARGIPTQQVPYLLPGPPSPPPSPTNTTSNTTQTPATTWYANDPRFLYSFSKLAVFSMTAYTRIILLDADMLVRQNMDELFTLPLLHDHPASTADTSTENNNSLPIFAATHACLCNPRTSNSSCSCHYPLSAVSEGKESKTIANLPDQSASRTTPQPGPPQTAPSPSKNIPTPPQPKSPAAIPTRDWGCSMAGCLSWRLTWACTGRLRGCCAAARKTSCRLPTRACLLMGFAGGGGRWRGFIMG